LINAKFQMCNSGISCDSAYDGTLLDCELFKGQYHVFDTIFFKGQDLRDDPEYDLNTRISLAETVCGVINSEKIITKKYTFGNMYTNYTRYMNDKFSSCASEKLHKDFDGIIYVPVNKPYPRVKNENVPLKWKPENLNTIDFKIKKVAPPPAENWADEDFQDDIFELYCYGEGGKDVLFTVKDYPDIGILKIPQKESSKYTDSSVIEFYFDKHLEQFVPLRSRTDKYRGNHISIARDNFDTIINPFDFATLKPGKERKNVYFFNMRRYHNWIKRKFIYKYSHKATALLDLACGKGGDLAKWCDNNIKYVEGYDCDSNSVKEAQHRSEKMVEKPTTKNFNYSFFVKNLATEQIVTQSQFDIATCFFAIHYFFESESTLLNFMKI